MHSIGLTHECERQRIVYCPLIQRSSLASKQHQYCKQSVEWHEHLLTHPSKSNCKGSKLTQVTRPTTGWITESG